MRASLGSISLLGLDFAFFLLLYSTVGDGRVTVIPWETPYKGLMLVELLYYIFILSAVLFHTAVGAQSLVTRSFPIICYLD